MKLGNLGLLMLCTVLAICSTGCSSLPASEEDPPPARKMLRLLPNIMADHRIRHNKLNEYKHINGGKHEIKKSTTHKAKARQADIDDMMEHLLRIRRHSMLVPE